MKYKQHDKDDIWVTLMAVLIVVIGLCFIVFFSAFLTWLTWNYAVVPIVASAGGQVGRITIWMAILLNILFKIIQRTLIPSKEVS